MNKKSEIILFKTKDEKISISVHLQDETVWLTQKQMAELYDVDRSVITKHINNIFLDEELQEKSVCANFAHTAKDGKNYKTKFYNLDAIIFAEKEYEKYRIIQDKNYISDFDLEIEKIKKIKNKN